MAAEPGRARGPKGVASLARSLTTTGPPAEPPRRPASLASKKIGGVVDILSVGMQNATRAMYGGAEPAPGLAAR
jgi:hypothetical protein